MLEFHNICYRITRNPISSAPSFYEMGEPKWFDVTVVSDEDIIAAPWTTVYHDVAYYSSQIYVFCLIMS